MNERNWLEKLKPGDEVLIDDGKGSQQIATVQGYDNETLLVADRTFWKSNGVRLGNGFARLVELTCSREEHEHAQLAARCREINWNKQPRHVLLQVLAAVGGQS